MTGDFASGRGLGAFAILVLAAVPAAGQDDVVQLDEINVSAAMGATTENSGTYSASTITIGDQEQAIRDVPRSVSVVTQEQMTDQNLTTIFDAAGATNGATIVQADDVGQRSTILVRGFVLDSYQVDGMTVSANTDVMMFDTAIYDRIELLRGPSGVLQGAREPGGTINLVRKAAPRERRIGVEASVGSWNAARFVLDLGGPLNETGSVRGRVIGVTEGRDSYLDIAHSEQTTLYGILEADVTDATTVRAGITNANGKNSTSRGLPTLATGELLNISRRAFNGADWNRGLTRGTEVFADVTHRFGNDAILSARANYLDRKRDGRIAYGTAPYDPETGLTWLLPERRIDREESWNFDTSLELPFEVAGLSQKVILGADYHRSDEQMNMGRGDDIPLDLFGRDYAVPEPEFEFDTFDRMEYEEYGLYGQAQLKPVAWGTIILGGRLGWWNSRLSNFNTGEVESDTSIDAHFTPFVAGIAELTPTLSAYASYASVFVPQDATDSDGAFIEPREGRQFEVGLKQELFGGAALASMALFDIEDSNRAVADPDDPDYSIASGKVRSRGFEAELSGEVTPSLDVILGYAFLDTEFASDPEQEGAVFEPRAPRNSGRLWGKYSFAGGTFDGLSLGAGLRAQSSVYRVTDGVKIETPGYGVADMLAEYTVQENVTARFLVNNVFDKIYYQSLGDERRQNYYGEPRSLTFTLSATF